MPADPAETIAVKSTSSQMALSLFEDMFDLGTSINAATREIGYQRNNFFCEVVNVGLTARRFLDAAHFIVAQEREVLERYDVELDYFKWLMRYDSRNVKHLRAIANEAQEAKVRVTDTPPGREPNEDDIWIQVQMVGLVGFGKGRIRFEVHKDLARRIRDPRRAHWLSLRISTAFSRSLARAIYDHVQQSVPMGRTDWLPLEVVRSWPGKMGANAAIFKYFKRDWLEPAVLEINDVSDIELSYETRTESITSKKIDRIRFLLKRKEGANAVLASLADASELYKTLREEFALSTAHFTEISENRDTWTDERISQAVEYTRWKNARGQVTKSPAGFLMSALRNNWKMSDAERTMVSVQAKLQVEEKKADAAKIQRQNTVTQNAASREDETRLRLNAESQKGRDHFNNADARERKELLRAWIASKEGKLTLRRMKRDVDAVTEVEVLASPDLAWYLGQFVFFRVCASRAAA